MLTLAWCAIDPSTPPQVLTLVRTWWSGIPMIMAAEVGVAQAHSNMTAVASTRTVRFVFVLWIGDGLVPSVAALVPYHSMMEMTKRVIRFIHDSTMIS